MHVVVGYGATQLKTCECVLQFQAFYLLGWEVSIFL